MDTGNRNLPGSTAWLCTAAGIAVLTVIGQHLPYWPGWLLNSVVILGVSAGVCAYKRSRASWACFWVLAAVCVVVPFLALTGLMNGDWTGSDWIIAVVEVVAWYWLLRFPARRPAAVTQPSHVVVHHVVHGGQGYATETAGQVLRDAVPDYLIRDAVPGAVERRAARRAISAAPAPLSKVAGAVMARVRR